MTIQMPRPFPGFKPVTTTTVQVSSNTSISKFKKAGVNGTLIHFILDESGSMNSCWDTTIAGFNEFVLGQKNADASAGKASLSLTKFDAPKIHNVFTNRILSEVPELNKSNYKPNGATNLLDAIGDSIINVNSELSKLKRKARPGVIIVIMTDGGENASTKFNNEQIKNMVKAAEASDWTFTFLGANIDAFAVGSTFGMSTQNSANYSTANMVDTMATLSASTTRMRSAKMSGASTADLYNTGLYTNAERAKFSK